MPNEIVTLTETEHDCWKCGDMLQKVKPPLDGWEFYCPTCCMVTSPKEVIAEAMRNKPKGSCGVVAAIPCKIKLA